MKKQIEEFVKARDYFGHPIMLNFNQRGPYHGSLIGGFISILIRILIASYLFIKAYNMVNL